MLITGFVASTLCAHSLQAEKLVVVQDGKAVAVRYVGAAWKNAGGGLAATGVERFLYADKSLDTGDFHIAARLKLERLEDTAAAFVINDSNLGFDGRGHRLFVEGPLFGGRTHMLDAVKGVVKPDVAFTFEAIREKEVTRFLIDNREVYRKEKWNGPAEEIGFRPWRNRITLERFAIEGDLVARRPPPKPCGEPLFVGGRDGYHTYRIPALAVTMQGTVLAFCEGRKRGGGDSGKIDLLVKRSTDDGKTWSGLKVVWDDVGNTCGNPCVVVDRDDGTIWLLTIITRTSSIRTTMARLGNSVVRRPSIRSTSARSWNFPVPS